MNHRVIRLKHDDYGVYISRYRNPTTGTALALRGTKQEVDEWLAEQEKRRLERQERLRQRRASRT